MFTAFAHDRNNKLLRTFRSESTRSYDIIGRGKTATKFRNFADAEKADREFYRKLSDQEHLNILLELTKHEPERRLERVYRITKRAVGRPQDIADLNALGE